MDHALIVEPRLDRCQGLLENILQAAALHRGAAASLAIVEHIRDVGCALLPATVDLEAPQFRGQAVPHGCPQAAVRDVQTRTVRPRTRFAVITIPVRPLQGHGCDASWRPDDACLGVPERGEFTAEVRLLDTPLVAAWPHRVANDRRRRMPGLAWSACGAQGRLASSAADHARWRTAPDTQADTTAAAPLAACEEASSRCLEMAMDGVKAHIDGRWQAPQVAPRLVRRRPVQPQAPRRGTVVARRDVGLLGAAEA